MHYGYAAASYDLAVTQEEEKLINRQLLYSFVPAVLSFTFSSLLLFASPVTPKVILFSFTGLLLT